MASFCDPYKTLRRFFFFLLLASACTNKGGQNDLPKSGAKEKTGKKKGYKFADMFEALKYRHFQTGQKEFFFDAAALQKTYLTYSLGPIWFNDTCALNYDGQKMLDMVENAHLFGLGRSRYQHSVLSASLDSIRLSKKMDEKAVLATKCEFLISDAYLKLGKDLQCGTIDSSQWFTDKKFVRKTCPNDALEALLQSVSGKGKPLEALLALQPAFAEYKLLREGLAGFVSKRKINKTVFQLPDYKKDSLAAYKVVAQTLQNQGYMEGNESFGTVFKSALAMFQAEHGLMPDSAMGQKTVAALSQSSQAYYVQAAATLEKWRWEPAKEQEYIFANIPSYTLRVYKNEQEQLSMRTVTGAKDTPTPLIDSQIDYVVSYPNWYVPSSIVRNEFLPKAKKDASYITRNNYELVGKNGKTITWQELTASGTAKMDFGVRQKGGDSNALGLVKFIFPNKFDIYFHDTPSKVPFKKDIRAYSHGCVRLHEPFKLAEYLLSREKNAVGFDSLMGLIESKQRRNIRFADKMPVHIQYFTAEGRPNGDLILFPDIYSKEKALYKAVEAANVFFEEKEAKIDEAEVVVLKK